jgi:hypothetical protein
MPDQRLSPPNDESRLQSDQIETRKAIHCAECAERWMRHLAQDLEESEKRATLAESRANVATAWAMRSDVRIRGLKRQLAKIELLKVSSTQHGAAALFEPEHERLHRHIRLIESRNSELENHLKAIQSSVSWRLGAPLRLISSLAPVRLRLGIKRLLRAVYRGIRGGLHTAWRSQPISQPTAPSGTVPHEAGGSTDFRTQHDLPDCAMAPVSQPALVTFYANQLQKIRLANSTEQPK